MSSADALSLTQSTLRARGEGDVVLIVDDVIATG